MDQIEQTGHQTLCAQPDHHAARLGQGLEARRQVRGLADHGFLLRRALAD
jgi:hypothetical protein